jgi:hypothetical protein
VVPERASRCRFSRALEPRLDVLARFLVGWPEKSGDAETAGFPLL